MHYAFVSSALAPENLEDRDSFDFFAVLLGGVVRHAQNEGHNVSVYIARKETHVRSDQGRVLQEVLKKVSDFNAIIIAPFDTEVVMTKLKEYFCKETDQKKEGLRFSSKATATISSRPLPIVFIDKGMDLNALKAVMPPGIIFANVACDAREGGFEAARMLHESVNIRRIPTTCRKFMVLSGLEGSKERIDGFKACISEQYHDKEIIVPNSPNLNFTKAGARRWMSDELDRFKEGLGNAFGSLDETNAWGVFACNDEMALGIRAIIASRYQQLRERMALAMHTAKGDIRYDGNLDRDYRLLLFLQDIRLVGFDGIAAARDLIQPMESQLPDPWLIGTISSQAELQAEIAIAWLRHVFSDEASEKIGAPETQVPSLIRIRRVGRA